MKLSSAPVTYYPMVWWWKNSTGFCSERWLPYYPCIICRAVGNK